MSGRFPPINLSRFFGILIIFILFLASGKNTFAACCTLLTCAQLSASCATGVNPSACTELGNCDCQTSCSGGGCFLAGTKIRTPDGEKNIEDIKVGDVVLSYGSKDGQYQVPTAEYIRRLGATKAVPKRTLKEKAFYILGQATTAITDIAKEAQHLHYRMFVE